MLSLIKTSLQQGLFWSMPGFDEAAALLALQLPSHCALLAAQRRESSAFTALLLTCMCADDGGGHDGSHGCVALLQNECCTGVADGIPILMRLINHKDFEPGPFNLGKFGPIVGFSHPLYRIVALES